MKGSRGGRAGRGEGRKGEGKEEGREKDTIPCLSDYLTMPMGATTLLPITLPNANNFLSACDPATNL